MDREPGQEALTPQRKSRVRASTTIGSVASQSIESSPETVTKSAVMNTLVTPSRPRISPISGGAPSPEVCVAGPPTGAPTVNFIARGFGVGSTVMLMVRPRVRSAHGSGVS